MSWPLKKSWKLRWRNARKVTGNAIPRGTAPFESCSELAVRGGLFKSESFSAQRGFLVRLHFAAVHRSMFRPNKYSFTMMTLHISLQAGSHELMLRSPNFRASKTKQDAVKSYPAPRSSSSIEAGQVPGLREKR
jgi:hypothetical protein